MPQTQELCHFAYLADKEARSDLFGGYIRDENDYTSNFTGALRRIINSYSQTGLKATSYMLDTTHERRMGCDATIILTAQNYSKVVCFEAKLPGLNSGKVKWDYYQTSTGLSHFSDQLARQNSFLSKFAMFEMFYCDYPFTQQPQYMLDDVSSCIWHKDAYSFDQSRGTQQPWKNADLITMLQKGNHGIDYILNEVCMCNQGTQINITGTGDNIARQFELEGYILQIQANE
jgi:hypothetical protein